MKPPMKLLLCLAVIMFAASTMLGSDAQNLGRKAPAAQKLPNTITINPNDVKILIYASSFAQFNADWKQVIDKVSVVNNKMPQMQQKMSALDSKSNECKNKSYTAADMTAAGCTDSMSVSECSVRLYRKCISVEWGYADTLAKELGNEFWNIKDAVSSAHTSFIAFLTDLELKMGL